MDTAETRKKHSIVVGMGSAGLTAALNLLISGHDVTLIDKISAHALKQKVRIPNELIQQFSLYDFDDAFLKKLAQKNFVCSIRKFQAYQLSLLKTIYEKRKITAKSGNFKEITGNLVMLQGDGAEVIAIDGESQLICLRDNTVLSFDNLIDATGSKRGIATLLQAQSNGKYHIDYVSDLSKLDHQHNAIVYFHAPVKKNLFKIPENASNNYYLSDFTDKNWKKDRAPLYYIGASAAKQKIYLMIEIPEELLHEPDHHKILAFAKPVLMEECELDVDSLNIQSSDLKIYSTFEIKNEITDIPYTLLGRGGACLVVGDALSPANFHFGHGISKAIADGNNLSKVFKNNHFNAEELKSRAVEIREEFSLRVNQLMLLNLQKKAELKEPIVFNQPETLAEYDLNSYVQYLAYSESYLNNFQQEEESLKRQHADKNHQKGPDLKKHRH